MMSQLHRFGWFFTAGSWKKDIKTGAAVTSLKTFVRGNDFSVSMYIWAGKLINKNWKIMQ